MAREFSDEDIQRHLTYEEEHGRDTLTSYKIIEQLRSERDFHFGNECQADQEVISLEIILQHHGIEYNLS
jgi:hypothetical protein